MAPVPPRWVSCQIGARERYAVPQAVHLSGGLAGLLTDAWKVKQRFHPALLRAPVISFNWSLAAFEATARARRLQGWDRVIARNEWFGRNTVRWLRQNAENLRREDREIVLFSYSYAAQKIFRFAREQGWRTVLGQIDPGPVEENIVAEEAAREPEFAGNWQRAPAAYWEHWREECELAEHILVNSEWAKLCLKETGIEGEKVKVVPLAYETEPGERDAERGVKRQYPARFARERPLRVLFLGQVNLRKGVARLLHAADLLKDAPIEFWMVGPVLISVPDRFRRDSRFRWVGPVTRAIAPSYFQGADVFILPTLSDGFALTQLEAMAHKLPAIVSRRCGEVVEHERNGLLLDEPTAEAIAAALLWCLRDPQRLPDLSRNAAVAQRFSIDALGQNLLALDH